MAEDYLSFEEALAALGMQEAELKGMVSQGKLRAFRDQNVLKFRRSDIENLGKQRGIPAATVTPGPDADTAVPHMVTPPAAEGPADLEVEEPFEFDDTSETLVGGDLGGPGTGDVELSLEPGPPGGAPEPATKVPTIELTAPAPDTGTEETGVPTLDLGEAPAGGAPTGDTEVPTMVLGLDQYDDTQPPTEDVATEEVALEPGELGADTEEATAPVEGAVGEEAVEGLEAEAAPGTGRVTPASAFGTGEVLAIKEQPSTLYTVMCALVAFVLLVPGALFFYCVASKRMPEWEVLKGIVKFFCDLLGVKP